MPLPHSFYPPQHEPINTGMVLDVWDRRGSFSSMVICITGTDTGVGKTVLTALLLQHLRRRGVRAHAVKPFCSGSRGDVQLLYGLQAGELTRDEINPYYFRQPVAPAVAAAQHGARVRLPEVIRFVKSRAAACEVLLVEGAGGLLVPLGHDFNLRDMCERLQAGVIVVSRNRLGTINHTLLTVEALRACRFYSGKAGQRRLKVVMMNQRKKDASAPTNSRRLTALLGGISLHKMAFLGAFPKRIQVLKRNEKKFQKVLAALV